MNRVNTHKISLLLFFAVWHQTQAMRPSKRLANTLRSSITELQDAGLANASQPLTFNQTLTSYQHATANILETIHCLASAMQIQEKLITMLAQQRTLEIQLKDRVFEYASVFPSATQALINSHDWSRSVDTDETTRSFIQSTKELREKGISFEKLDKQLEDYAPHAADATTKPAIDWARIQLLSEQSRGILVGIYKQNPLNYPDIGLSSFNQAPGCMHPLVELQKIILADLETPVSVENPEYIEEKLKQKQDLIDWYATHKDELNAIQEKLTMYLAAQVGHKVALLHYRYNRFDREQRLCQPTRSVTSPDTAKSPAPSLELAVLDTEEPAAPLSAGPLPALSPSAAASPRTPMESLVMSPRTHRRKNSRSTQSPATPVLSCCPSPNLPPTIDLGQPSFEHSPTHGFPIDQRTIVWHIDPQIPLNTPSYAKNSAHEKELSTIRHRIPWCLEHYFRHLAIETTHPNSRDSRKQDPVLNFPGCIRFKKHSGKLRSMRGVFIISRDAVNNRIYHRFFHSSGDEFVEQEVIDGMLAQTIIAPDEKMNADLKPVSLPPITIEETTYTYTIEENDYMVRITDEYHITYEVYKGHTLKKYVPKSWLWPAE